MALYKTLKLFSSAVARAHGGCLPTALISPIWTMAAVGALHAQTDLSSPYASIYQALDRRFELGEGHVGTAPRVKEKEELRCVLNPRNAGREAQQQARNELDNCAANLAAQRRAENEKRIAEFGQRVQERCGREKLQVAEIGMEEDVFRQCTMQATVGGITHVLSYEESGVTARLYVLSEGDIHKIYTVNKKITALVPRSREPFEEPWRGMGNYPDSTYAQNVIALPDKSYFAFGQSYGEDWGLYTGKDVEDLVDGDRLRQPPDQAPMVWDSHRRGWVKVAMPPECRGTKYLHTLSALPDGRVLVAGGLCYVGSMANEPAPQIPQNRLSIWNAKSKNWEVTAPLQQARIFHTANVLPDGSVLLVGGYGDPLPQPANKALASAEMYVQAKTQAVDSMLVGRAKHRATLMTDGSVLVTGGLGSEREVLSLVEQWDSVSRKWKNVPPMHSPRYAHSATLLRDGRVLVAGGIDAQERALNSTEIYDPRSQNWSAGPPLPEPLQSHGAALLSDGAVLLAGGWVTSNGRIAPWVQRWMPGDDRWRSYGMRTKSEPSSGLSQRPTIIPDDHGQATIFSLHDIFFWHLPQSDGPNASGLNGPSDSASMPGRWLPAQSTSNPDANATPPATQQRPTTQPGVGARLLDSLYESRALLAWLTLLLLAIYAVHRLRKRYPPKGRHIKVWRPVVWLIRVVIYGSLLIVAVPSVIGVLGLLMRDRADECNSARKVCLDNATKLLERDWKVPGRSKFSRPTIPCDFVGIWVTRAMGSELRFHLKDDGSYVMDSSVAVAVRPDAGHWVVQGKYIIWHSTTQANLVSDINEIVSNNGKHFELIELNGIHSHFEFQEALDRRQCKSTHAN